MSAPYASMARSVFLEAMWPTRKAMPSRSTSLIMLSSVTRRSAYSGEISCGGFMEVRVPLLPFDTSRSAQSHGQIGPGRPQQRAPRQDPRRLRRGPEGDVGDRRVERGGLTAPADGVDNGVGRRRDDRDRAGVPVADP